MKTLSVCSTYGRIPYLGRMLSSFINQNYDDKHLVIINDDKNVELCCNRKNVTIINCNQRLQVPDKRNIGIAHGKYDIIFPMDDDDILTPDRITNHLGHYDDPTVNAYRNLASYIIYGDVFKRADASPHNSISFKQTEWWRVGGYTNNHIYEDVDLHDRISGLKTSTSENFMDFIYQFGGVNYHLSCNPGKIYNFEQLAHKQLTSLNLVGKKFWIEPDNEQYNICLELKRRFDFDKKEIKITHLEDAKIEL